MPDDKQVELLAASLEAARLADKELFNEKLAGVQTQFSILRELYDSKITAGTDAVKLAQKEMERRLAELNQLRAEVLTDRSELVRKEEYQPAHEELRRQRTVDSERMIVLAADIKVNATDIASMKSNLSWLTRLIVGAVLLGIIAFAFERLKG